MDHQGIYGLTSRMSLSSVLIWIWIWIFGAILCYTTLCQVLRQHYATFTLAFEQDGEPNMVLDPVHIVWEASKIRSQCTSIKPIKMESQQYLQHFLLNKQMFWLSYFSKIVWYKILPTILHVSIFFQICCNILLK